jgi:hypothetical protein
VKFLSGRIGTHTEPHTHLEHSKTIGSDNGSLNAASRLFPKPVVIVRMI